MWSDVLIDSCVIIDALLPFRANHKNASTLLRLLARSGTVCHIPSHAYFEFAVACITHCKNDAEKLRDHPIDQTAFPNLKLEVVALNNAYANELLRGLSGRPIPDLKSQDLIYFCIARDRDMTLITQDRKLRNTSRKGGIAALHVDEALEEISEKPESRLGAPKSAP
jgi:hypothetical protein